MKKIKNDPFSKANLMKSDKLAIEKFSHIPANIAEEGEVPDFISVAEFISKCRKVHGYKYDYSHMFDSVLAEQSKGSN